MMILRIKIRLEKVMYLLIPVPMDLLPDPCKDPHHSQQSPDYWQRIQKHRQILLENVVPGTPSYFF